MLSKEVIQPASQEMLMSIRVCYRGKSFNRGVMSFWENAEAYTNHSIKISLQYFYFFREDDRKSGKIFTQKIIKKSLKNLIKDSIRKISQE